MEFRGVRRNMGGKREIFLLLSHDVFIFVIVIAKLIL
jgi:hypothetical protein